MNKRVYKNIIKIFVILVVFFVSLYVISGIMNKDSIDTTMEMGPATYPLIYVQLGGEEVNCLRGYKNSMDTGQMRETLTPLQSGRKVSLSIDTYGNEILGISYEIRSIDGSRLIESTQIPEYETVKEEIHTSFIVKDLIKQNQEYMMVLLLDTGDSDTIYYYTRIVHGVEYHVSEKIEYVLDFNRKTFDETGSRDLVKYLESNSEGDNTTLNKVTIHSSFKQVTWGDLQVTRETKPRIEIKEMNAATASLRLYYLISVTEEGVRKDYRVTEYYRIRYTPERMYLLDFERDMNQIFDKDSNTIINNKIVLGITEEDIQLEESDAGNVFAYVVGNSLYSYHITDNKLALLFSFYGEGNEDERCSYAGHEIKILNVDEAGNVMFLVYGYMNRGRHEGEVGISVYYYNSMANTIEEITYIPYQRSPQLLCAEIDRMAYVNKSGYLFFMVDQDIYSVHMESRACQSLISDVSEGSYQISDSSKMLVWQSGEDESRGEKLILLNLSTGNRSEIKAGAGEYIKPLGFIGEDLIYGLIRKTDLITDQAGKTIFPMYCVKIFNETEGVLKTKDYEQENVYITDILLDKNQIKLFRMGIDEEGFMEILPEDSLVNVVAETVGKNYVETVATQTYQKMVQIVAKNTIEKNTLKYLTPKEVLFEGGRELPLEFQETVEECYYVYGKEGIEGIFVNESNALNLAYEKSGVVVDERGECVWQRSSRSQKNQIMAVKGEMVSETKDSLAVCLEAMLSLNGVSRNAEYMLSRGNTVTSILNDELENTRVLELTGCSMDSVLYYVDKDIPVLVTLQDGNALLLVGFNELNTVVMNPLTGTVDKMGMNDSRSLFEQNGNRFITYYKMSE